MEGRGEMAKEAAFQRVRENFQRVKDFGWFAPSKSWTKKFKAWPKGKCLDGLGYRQAAVLFLLTHHRGELHVLITKRSYHVTTHKGEQCLPGGNREAGDSTPAQTALREAEEEVGLDPLLAELVCTLPPVVSGWENLTCVTPVVCLLKCSVEELRLACNPDEVTGVSWIPIRTFVESNAMELIKGKWRDIPITMASFHYIDQETKTHCFIWGLTAQICISVSAIALDKEPDFIHYGGYGVVDVQHIDSKNVAAVLHQIALTSKRMEQWRDSALHQINSTMPITQWNSNLTILSKL